MTNEAQLGMLFAAWIVAGVPAFLIATFTNEASQLHQRCIDTLWPWCAGFAGLLALWGLNASVSVVATWLAVCLAAMAAWFVLRKGRFVAGRGAA